MHRKIAAVLICVSAAAGYAQTVTKHGIATQFNQWKAYGSTNLVAGANPLVPIAPCGISAGNTQFPALSASTPIKIVDPGNPSIDETITPTSIVVGSTCTATLTTTNAHPTPWYIISGTGGLQEAINNTAASGVLNVVDLDAAWHNSGFGASTIYAATGNANIALSDGSIAPSSVWKWNGTHYVPTYSLNGLSATIAAGAAAGTSPTVSNNTGSSGNSWTANVTTGTATTTGTLFTETVTASAGNLNCVVQAVGANIPPAFTVTGTSTTVVTIAVAVAPAVSTAYIFNGTCE